MGRDELDDALVSRGGTARIERAGTVVAVIGRCCCMKKERRLLDDRVINDFAQRLVPEAFTRRHTADRVEIVDARPSGAAAFDHWVEQRLREAPTERYAWGGRPVRYVIVEASDGTRWRWEGDACCEPEWLAEVVCEESHHLPEPWVFAVELEWPDPVPLDETVQLEWPDAVQLDEGEPTGTVMPQGAWQATWYAEARGRGIAVTRAGQVEIDGDDRIVGRRELAPRTGLPKAFHGVLRGHPARKSHPLRRR